VSGFEAETRILTWRKRKGHSKGERTIVPKKGSCLPSHRGREGGGWEKRPKRGGGKRGIPGNKKLFCRQKVLTNRSGEVHSVKRAAGFSKAVERRGSGGGEMGRR